VNLAAAAEEEQRRQARLTGDAERQKAQLERQAGFNLNVCSLCTRVVLVHTRRVLLSVLTTRPLFTAN